MSLKGFKLFSIYLNYLIYDKFILRLFVQLSNNFVKVRQDLKVCSLLTFLFYFQIISDIYE